MRLWPEVRRDVIELREGLQGRPAAFTVMAQRLESYPVQVGAGAPKGLGTQVFCQWLSGFDGEGLDTNHICSHVKCFSERWDLFGSGRRSAFCAKHIDPVLDGLGGIAIGLRSGRVR